MNTIKAIQTLSRRMDKASKQEREAFNYLVDFCGDKHKEIIIGNQLFGKLYIYLYGELIKHYEATLFDEIPRKELNRILARPLKTIVEEFVDTINMREMYQDATGKTATWNYEDTAENLRAMVVKAMEEFETKNYPEFRTETGLGSTICKKLGECTQEKISFNTAR